MKYKITYRKRRLIDRFKCFEWEEQITMYNTWQVGGLLYGYTAPYNTITIDIDMIIKIEKLKK